MKISAGKITRAQKVVIYGPEGIGKTTLASHFPEPLFIDTEGGTTHMDVRRVDGVTTWEQLIATVKEVTPDVCKTLVIDTADWAEQMNISDFCKAKGIKGIEDVGYGKGYVYVAERFGALLADCDKLIQKGINVVFTAHAKMRKFEQPDELGAYDRWEMKLSRQTAPMLKEWADMVLFCNYQTNVVTDEKTKSKKAMGGKRVMYTQHHPCWDAKNRHGLPEKLDMDYKQIAGFFTAEPKKTPPEDEETPLYKLKKLMAKHGMTPEDVQAACALKNLQPEQKKIEKYDPEFIQNVLLDKWDGFVNFITNKVWQVPFDENN